MLARSLGPEVVSQTTFKYRLGCSKRDPLKSLTRRRVGQYKKLSSKSLSSSEKKMNRYDRLMKRSQNTGVILMDGTTGTEIERRGGRTACQCMEWRGSNVGPWCHNGSP